MGLRGPQSTVDTSLVVDLAAKGLSHSQIAKVVDTGRTNVTRLLAGISVPEQAEIEEYKKHRADIFSGLQTRILKTMSDEDLKKIPVGSRITNLAILYDKERLERGQSSVNILTSHLPADKVSDLEEIARNVAMKQSKQDVSLHNGPYQTPNGKPDQTQIDPSVLDTED